MECGAYRSQAMNQLIHMNSNALPNDLEFDSLQGGLECDVDQVIKHELSVEGELDFNFEPPMHPPPAASTPSTTSIGNAAPTHSWVH